MMTDSQSRRVCGSDQMLGCDVRSTCALKHQARMALGILIYPSAGLAESDHSNAFVYSVYCSSRPTAPTAPDLRHLKVLHDALLLGHRTWFLYRLAWTNSTSLSCQVRAHPAYHDETSVRSSHLSARQIRRKHVDYLPINLIGAVDILEIVVCTDINMAQLLFQQQRDKAMLDLRLTSSRNSCNFTHHERTADTRPADGWRS